MRRVRRRRKGHDEYSIMGAMLNLDNVKGRENDLTNERESFRKSPKKKPFFSIMITCSLLNTHHSTLLLVDSHFIFLGVSTSTIFHVERFTGNKII